VARGIPYAALRRQTPLPRIVSQPGKKNGLYWPAASEEDESPLGVLAASAAAEGYRAGQQRMPYPRVLLPARRRLWQPRNTARNSFLRCLLAH
jgi:hypothetical protein